MKHEIDIQHPADLVEAWPGHYRIFSWLEYAATVPGLLHMVTTRREDGKPNANLNAWAMFAGDRDKYTAVIGILNSSHTYENILRGQEFCIGFPGYSQREPCFKSIAINGDDCDEITESGFTVEPGKAVAAPRILEMPLTLECRLDWHRPLAEGSLWHLFAGRVVHLAVSAEIAVPDAAQRLTAMDLMWNVHNPMHPLTHEHAPSAFGRLEVAGPMA